MYNILSCIEYGIVNNVLATSDVTLQPRRLSITHKRHDLLQRSEHLLIETDIPNELETQRRLPSAPLAQKRLTPIDTSGS